VVALGVQTTLAPVVAFRNVAGLQVYVFAPLADRFTAILGQVVGAAGLMVMVGSGFTVTVTVVVAVQPAAVVPVTVYVVVAVGEAFTVEPDVALRPVAGAHE
jgi:hypothetical protein